MRYEALIRRSFDVVSVSGDELLCRCPWHQDGGKPNLYVNGKRGLYLCHSCGKRGHLKGITGKVPTATAGELRDRLDALRRKDDLHQHGHPESWLKQFAFDHPGWAARGLSPETIARFHLGYDPRKDVLTIPVRDAQGCLLGVITRRLDNLKPKYLYPKGFPIGKHLFGAWLIHKDERKVVALVEGSVDAIACWDARIPAMAMMGARLTRDQVQVLRTLGVKTAVIFTDNDGPGRDAIQQVNEALRGSGIAVRVAIYRSYWRAKDPAELTDQRRRKAFHSALPWHRWVEST